MSIHKHTVKRMDAELDRMIKDINPLSDLINMGGYENMDNQDKKYYAKISHRIRKLNKKINHLVNDYHMT